MGSELFWVWELFEHFNVSGAAIPGCLVSAWFVLPGLGCEHVELRAFAGLRRSGLGFRVQKLPVLSQVVQSLRRLTGHWPLAVLGLGALYSGASVIRLMFAVTSPSNGQTIPTSTSIRYGPEKRATYTDYSINPHSPYISFFGGFGLRISCVEDKVVDERMLKSQGCRVAPVTPTATAPPPAATATTTTTAATTTTTTTMIIITISSIITMMIIIVVVIVMSITIIIIIITLTLVVGRCKLSKSSPSYRATTPSR